MSGALFVVVVVVDAVVELRAELVSWRIKAWIGVDDSVFVVVVDLVVSGEVSRVVVVRLPNGGIELSEVSGLVVCNEILLSANEESSFLAEVELFKVETSESSFLDVVELESSFLAVVVELLRVEISIGSWVGGT
jgi:hypothetical protein